MTQIFCQIVIITASLRIPATQTSVITECLLEIVFNFTFTTVCYIYIEIHDNANSCIFTCPEFSIVENER